jgi:hypothetical protein
MMSRLKKFDQVRFWSMLLIIVFAAVCLVHTNTSRAKQADRAVRHPQITVERIPALEARRMGIEPRNN